MHGIPKIQLKTKADYLRLQGMALDGDLRPAQVERLRGHWQSLLAGRYRYDADKVLADGVEPDGSEPQYRVIIEQGDDDQDVRRQYVRVEDEHARIHALGFDVTEVQQALEQLGVSA
jgi:hypothetical protein